MWEKALLKVAAKASVLPRSPRANTSFKQPVLHERIQLWNESKLSSKADKLQSTNSALLSIQSQSRLTLHTSMEGQPLTSEDLILPIIAYPFSLAVEAVSVLIEGGQHDQVIHILTSWNRGSSQIMLSSRQRAQKLLLSAVSTIGSLKDAQTLRSVLSILDSSLAQQVHFRATGPRGAFGVSFQQKLDLSESALLTCLGANRTYVLLVEVVKTLCEFREDEGVSQHEKALLIDTATRAFSQLRGENTLIVPYSLYDQFGELSDSSLFKSLQQVNPRLLNAFQHPSQYSMLTALSLPRHEVRYIEKTLSTTAWKWEMASNFFLSRSQLLNVASENRALRRIILGSSNEIGIQILDSIREKIIGQLVSPRRSNQKVVAYQLLQNPKILRKLNLSHISVFTSYALSFRSMREANSTFVKACVKVIPYLHQRHRYVEIAQLAWNHLSVNCSANVSSLQNIYRGFDIIASSVCRVMREKLTDETAESWMGHRTLSLLQVANDAGVVTPAHIIPLCAAAMDAGVHFSTVQESIYSLYPNDDITRMWIVNMVRICAESNDMTVTVHRSRSLLSKSFKSALDAVLCLLPTCTSSVEVRVPSRSKQLALWTLINDPTLSPALLATINYVFLDNDTRQSFLKGDYLINTHVSCDSEIKSEMQIVNQIFTWETVAGIASNCTTDSAYARILQSLVAGSIAGAIGGEYKLTGEHHLIANSGRIQQLIQSEIDR